MQYIYKNPLNENGKSIIFPEYYVTEGSSLTSWEYLKVIFKAILIFILALGLFLLIIKLIPEKKEKIRYFDGTTGYIFNNHSISNNISSTYFLA